MSVTTASTTSRQSSIPDATGVLTALSGLHAPAPATESAARQALARIPITRPPGLFPRLIGAVARRLYGQEPDNGYAMLHQREVLFAVLGFERRVAKWNSLDERLKSLAVMAVAMEIGCSWCVDFGFYEAHRKNVDLTALRHLSRWRESDVYSELDRQVIEYAIAASATPAVVTDEMVAPLRAALGDAALVELTMMIAVENERSRFNAALGLVSQGFAASCQLSSS